MNIRMLIYILGKVLLIEGSLMTLPIVCGCFYGEWPFIIYYIICAAAYIILGLLISMKKPKNMTVFIKDGCVATALSWVVLSIAGCIPFILTGEIPSFTDAVFETASGFSTTGASILTDVEAMSHTSLMWRSLTHWIGGMGVLVFLLAVVPMTGGSNMNLMRAESPGPTVGKIVPKVRSTAKMLYLIYLALTVTEIVILFVCGMPFFDSVCSAFGTAGTGGFGVRNDSFASYAPHIQWIVAIFMIMFGANFNFYYYITTKQVGKAFKMSEVKCYLVVIAIVTAIICFSVRGLYGNFGEALRHSFFQVATIITTTGFATTDFDLWPSVAKLLLLGLMILGACASSTGGGIKVARFQIMLKAVKREIQSYIHPKTVKKVHIDGKTVDSDIVHSVALYFFIYLIIFAASMFIVSLEGHDLVTVFSSVAATFNNIGPGLSLVGPTQNYSFFSGVSKWVFIFDMLAGRLELMPLIVFLAPTTYKGIIKKPHKTQG
ncbi:trk system potassium uptake protein TrkH [Ruminococcaceae bacterium R-25]|nr:trk system potassium uptake protein TrkH [Ruminococcaceae bacterium R-25]SUQ21860.1 trk system potassium uptake protein TrkH [Oscillospiraceae bacterium]